jgi:hypothetical protein
LKIIKNDITEPLVFIINQCFRKGSFPNLMKLAKVIPLYKKDNNMLFDNYRPVSLLSSMSKVFEKIIYNQIYEHFTTNNLLYTSQYGFRSMHSTELAALELCDRIICELDKGETPINIFLDLSKAFDTIDHTIMLSKLKYYGFSDISLALLESYLSGRQQFVNFNDVKSDLMPLSTGVPQGSILGPLLFLIYVNDISEVSNLFKPIVYADDTTLSATLGTFKVGSDSWETMESNINNELGKYSEWFKLNKLSINTSKTKAMLFHMPQKTLQYPILSLDNDIIEYVREFNFLGIVIDENLNWKSHVNKISTKISKIVGLLTKLKHFLPERILLNIYNALIVPHLNYGALLWENSYQRVFMLQKKAVRAVTNSKFNAHTDMLFKRLNTLKCKDISALHGLKFCFKLEKGLLPSYFNDNVFTKSSTFHNYLTRRDIYCIPFVRHEFAKRNIRYKIPVLFNATKDAIKEKIYTHSLSGFKAYVKYDFIKSYSSSCILQNCYVCGNST